MTYSSIAMGLLSGKYTKDTVFEKGDIRGEQVPLFKDETFDKALDAVDKLKGITKKYDASVAQVAINWVINQKGVSTAIVGARKPTQIAGTVPASDWILQEEDIRQIEELLIEYQEKIK